MHAPGSFADWVNARLRSLLSFLILADADMRTRLNVSCALSRYLSPSPFDQPGSTDDNDNDNKDDDDANNTSCIDHCPIRH